MTKIQEVIMYVPALGKDLIGFYQKLVGTAPFSSSPDSASFQFGSSVLILKLGKKSTNPVHIAFNVKDLEQEYELHKSDFVFFKDEETNSSFIFFERWRCLSLYFLDPLGNVLEYCQKKEAKSKDIEANQIAIGEVGFVTDDVTTNAEKIRSDSGLPFFKRSTGGETFRALGEDDGLVILNHVDRSWYPYEMPNDFHTQINVKFEHKKQSYCLNVSTEDDVLIEPIALNTIAE